MRASLLADRLQLRDPRRLRVLFLATMGVLLATLGCLTWWLIEQDRSLSGQRQYQQRETAADLAAASLERGLLSVERQLDEILAGTTVAPPATGGVFAFWSGASIQAIPGSALAFVPDSPAAPRPSSDLFAAADALERNRDYRAAVARLASLRDAPDPSVRAEAWVRTAVAHLKDGDIGAAQRAYERLATLGQVPVAGWPASIAGGFGLLRTWEVRGDDAAAKRAAELLAAEIRSQRWQISASGYGSLADELERRGLGLAPADDRAQALADAVDRVWNGDSRGSAGRASITTSALPVVVVWRSRGSARAVFAATAEYLRREWLGAGMEAISLTDGADRTLWQPPATPGPASVRLMSATGLPWTIESVNLPSLDSGDRARRLLLISSLGVLLALVVVGAGFIGRSVARELAVARLQADFVTTVSHELRTPLTALYQLSELLTRGRVASEDDRRAYYAHLYAESDRLRRLVEGLLTFGRLDAGRLAFQFERLDAAAVVRQSVTEFQNAQPGRHRLEIDDVAAPAVRGDREALRCAVWNLLENAVKYSPGADVVRIGVARRGRHVEIAVEDRGVGIPRKELRRIFQRFVRGSAARDQSIRGTGIGLAMVRQIAAAHGGKVTVESEPGKGSTFRLFLPVEEPA